MTINPEDVVMFSATELLELYREKRLSPVEVVEAILHHIDTQQLYRQENQKGVG